MIANIGGVFLYSEEPAKLAAWYKDHLRMDYEHSAEYEAFFLVFPYMDEQEKTKRYTCWSIMKAEKRKFTDQKGFMINLRTRDLESLVSKLEQANVAVKGIEEFNEGKFAWIRDPEGNFIELWEDISSSEKDD